MALPLEVARHETEHDERASIPNMDTAIDGRPADVDPDGATVARAEGLFVGGQGVVGDDLHNFQP